MQFLDVNYWPSIQSPQDHCKWTFREVSMSWMEINHMLVMCIRSPEYVDACSLREQDFSKGLGLGRTTFRIS